jgi:hypothetical protein
VSWTAQAETLEDTSGLGSDAAMMCGQARATGLDPNSIRSLIGASLALGCWPQRGDGWTPYPSDTDLVEALFDLQDAVYRWWKGVERLTRAVARRRARLIQCLSESEPDHPQRPEWHWELVDCNTALEILTDVPARLNAAINKLAAVPIELGDTYAAVYTLVAAGRVMPHNGRWITGEEVPCSST